VAGGGSRPPAVTVFLWVLMPVALIGAAVVAVGWIMSNRFLVPKPYLLMPEFQILAVDDDASNGGAVVTLPVADEPTQFSDVAKEGIYDLLWQDGHGRLGSVLEGDGRQVVRRVVQIVGEGPRPGDLARLGVTIFHRDPRLDHGIEFEELELAGPAGRLRAWWVQGDGNRAVLALHGRRRADLTETLRILPTLRRSGWSVLALAYRNHDRSDPSPGGLFHYGHSEVEDALAGVAELERRGVQEVVLYGFSMGGAVALEALKRWPADGPRLQGVLLDSPLLDPRTVIAKAARASGLPLAGLLTDLALWVARLRTGVDWSKLDQRRFAAAVDVPLLLVAGTADHTIPIDLVDEFAALAEAPVEYLRLEGVDHVEGWNRDRQRYEQAVESFLDRVAESRDARRVARSD
jgi:alpha-beta hydrolase superfamily lysophospholipase